MWEHEDKLFLSEDVNKESLLGLITKTQNQMEELGDTLSEMKKTVSVKEKAVESENPTASQQDNKGMRYAYEWYVNTKDEWYWRRTNELVERNRKKAARLMALSIAASSAAVVTSAFSLLRKLQ